MLAILVTEEVSQASRGWLKEAARANIAHMSATEETSQEPTGWLKEEAPQNMWPI